jgi:hypothetical protein
MAELQTADSQLFIHELREFLCSEMLINRQPNVFLLLESGSKIRPAAAVLDSGDEDFVATLD